jgi:hypothetical protein
MKKPLTIEAQRKSKREKRFFLGFFCEISGCQPWQVKTLRDP